MAEKSSTGHDKGADPVDDGDHPIAGVQNFLGLKSLGVVGEVHNSIEQEPSGTECD